MLVLSKLHELLSQVLDLPNLHTAALLTPEGQLVSFAAGPARSKDDVLVLVGLSGEIWQETDEQGVGMAESEVCPEILLKLPLVVLIPTNSLERYSFYLSKARNNKRTRDLRTFERIPSCSLH